MAEAVSTGQREPDACAVRQVDPDRVSLGRSLLLGEGVYAATAAIFRALGDPSRAKIVYSLLQQELCVCDSSQRSATSRSQRRPSI